MIGLVDFLKAAGIEIDTDSLKIHLACWNGREHPIDVYYAGNFKTWQEGQTRRNFSCAQVLSLIDLGQGNWLFAGIYKVIGDRPHPEEVGNFLYSTKLVPKQEGMIGRIVAHHKRTRASYIWYKTDIVLPIVEIRREKMTIADFPGYNSVVISHDSLKIITGQKIASWHGALSNIKGVYLITDTMTGKHYVGKASGEVGIWQRWCSYAENGHGDNVELKKLLGIKGPPYMKHFQYSILEIADTHASDMAILARESYWINALRTREFGLN
jgi:GIY-YIG catalytic domain